MRAAAIGGCIVICSPRTRRRPRLLDDQRAAERRLPVEPGEGTRIEWQADFYASCLLMPRKLVIAAWDEMFPDRKPRVLQPATPIDHPFVEIARFDDGMPVAEFDRKPTIRRWKISPSRSPSSSSFRRSPCASGWRSSGCCTATVPLQRLLSDGA